ncbi:MAG: ATP-binding cassette domain-containing protein [Fluviicoccus sp.]|uniref:phosphatase domain-containing putative toxin n=1 Tax=Fluviicoccus sp. TaxID=2003552 RepID=UPI0027195BA1|nr:ATP-binding cassette domain-containing protein [Fluviicoccus sp.]MDO8331094.1 ATP-binding cassette domain-containing protein [Fluviicoccus sp.]
MQHILELQGYGLAYNDKKVLLSIDMTVPDTGITAILGPSGTGKSSLLRTLAGFNDNHPSLLTWGEVNYRGAGRPALVMQKAALMVSTVLENLLTSLPHRSSLTRLEQIELLSGFCTGLDQVWVIEKLSHPVTKLEFYEQRAVAILREALARPALLMLDEPTESLSDDAAGKICRLIHEVAALQPVLMISHHLAQTQRLADHVVLFSGGMVQESGPTAAFFQSPRSEAGKIFIRSGSCPESSLEPVAEEDEDCAMESIPQPPRAEHLAPALTVKSRFMGPRGFVWLIPGRLAGTPWPGIVRDTDEDLDALRNVGITRLVSLTEIPFDEVQAARFGIQCANVPIPDMHAPTLAVAFDFCRDTDRWLQAGETVAIHCKAGLGRTGTLLAVYWLWTGQGEYNAIEAIEYVRRMESGMIQSQAQVDFLSEFAESLQTAAPASPHQTRTRPGEAPHMTTITITTTEKPGVLI